MNITTTLDTILPIGLTENNTGGENRKGKETNTHNQPKYQTWKLETKLKETVL